MVQMNYVRAIKKYLFRTITVHSYEAQVDGLKSTENGERGAKGNH